MVNAAKKISGSAMSETVIGKHLQDSLPLPISNARVYCDRIITLKN